jgi:hypothetical protein
VPGIGLRGAESPTDEEISMIGGAIFGICLSRTSTTDNNFLPGSLELPDLRRN